LTEVRVPEPRSGPAGEQTLFEIGEQPAAIERVLVEHSAIAAEGKLLDGLRPPTDWQRVRLVGCGSSHYAAQVVARVLRELCRLPVVVDIASEPTSDELDPATLTVAFSQSGETADVLAMMERKTGTWVAVTNTPHSTIAGGSDLVIPLGAGHESGVAATKTFSTQVVAGTLMALSLAVSRGLPSRDAHRWIDRLAGLPQRFADTDALAGPASLAVAPGITQDDGVIFTSRGAGVPYALEGALKLKELSYQWTEALPAGELKHGPIALVREGTVVIAVDSDPMHKLAANLEELRARGAHVLTVGSSPGAALPVDALPDPSPWGPLESVVALQHLARAVAVSRGLNVDRPRNLAKSVTVE
jgi:glucosamine--fructose-6-phosphate aminotransferase (isomerizing)